MHLFGRSRLTAVIAGAALIATSLATATMAPPAGATSFTVDATYDAVDSDLLDGVCDDGTGHCTLRAALMEAINDDPEVRRALGDLINLAF